MVKWLLERFLKSVPGNDEKLRPSAVGFKFVYSVELGVLNLSCDVSEIQRSAEQTGRACILVSGNYHVALSGENPLEQARAAISLYPKRLAHFDEITQTIFGLEPS